MELCEENDCFSFFFLCHLTLISWSSRWCLPFFLKIFLHGGFVNSSHSLPELPADLLPLAKTSLSPKFQGHSISHHLHVCSQSGEAHDLFQQCLWLTLSPISVAGAWEAVLWEIPLSDSGVLLIDRDLYIFACHDWCLNLEFWWPRPPVPGADYLPTGTSANPLPCWTEPKYQTLNFISPPSYGPPALTLFGPHPGLWSQVGFVDSLALAKSLVLPRPSSTTLPLPPHPHPGILPHCLDHLDLPMPQVP